MAGLFDTFKLRGVELRNRIGVSPMCQYSAVDGAVNDWHLVHLGARAVGGAGLVVAEDTAVLADGRISPGDAGLWSDHQVDPFRRITTFLKAQGAVPGVQIGHAGRKGSTTIPWAGGQPQREGRALTPDEGAWDIIAPSACAFGGDRAVVPSEMTEEQIREVQAAFRDAARRADHAGFELLELHGSNGYLINSFYSPLTNRRDDGYGGSFDNRIRFAIEISRGVREVWPDAKPLAFRMAATDYLDGGWTVEDAVELARRLKDEGVDLIDILSVGGTVFGTPVPWSDPELMVAQAERLRRDAGVAVAVSFISAETVADPTRIAAVVENEQADITLLGRTLLRDPQWPVNAAAALGTSDRLTLPNQYEHWLTGLEEVRGDALMVS